MGSDRTANMRARRTDAGFPTRPAACCLSKDGVSRGTGSPKRRSSCPPVVSQPRRTARLAPIRRLQPPGGYWRLPGRYCVTSARSLRPRETDHHRGVPRCGKSLRRKDIEHATFDRSDALRASSLGLTTFIAPYRYLVSDHRGRVRRGGTSSNDSGARGRPAVLRLKV